MINISLTSLHNFPLNFMVELFRMNLEDSDYPGILEVI